MFHSPNHHSLKTFPLSDRKTKRVRIKMMFKQFHLFLLLPYNPFHSMYVPRSLVIKQFHLFVLLCPTAIQSIPLHVYIKIFLGDTCANLTKSLVKIFKHDRPHLRKSKKGQTHKFDAHVLVHCYSLQIRVHKFLAFCGWNQSLSVLKFKYT